MEADLLSRLQWIKPQPRNVVEQTSQGVKNEQHQEDGDFCAQQRHFVGEYKDNSVEQEYLWPEETLRRW